MTDHDALLRAIIEQPNEDTPRLVFADWLDENADAFPAPAVPRLRAAFIRDDVTLSARDEYDPARLRWELIEKPRREAEPWVKATYAAELLAPERSGGILRRGFPWWVRLAPSQFLANVDRVLAQIPAGMLSYSRPDNKVDALSRSPHLARLTGLHLRQTALAPSSVQLLAHSPHAAGLGWLSAGHDGLTLTSLAVLLRSPLLPRLTRLDLDGRSWLGPAFVNELPRVTGPVRLRELGLAESGLTHAHVQQLLTAPALEHVERLSLVGNRLGMLGHEAVARLPLDRLRKLDLSATAPGPEGVRLLSTSLTLTRLERLGYRHNHMNSTLMVELATCYEVSNLRVLDLASNAIGNDGATAIARSPHFAGLLVLNLGHCMVGDEGILAVLESPLADGLVLLDLTGSPASAETKELLKARMGDRVRL